MGDALPPIARESSQEVTAAKRTAPLELRAAPQTGRATSVLIEDLPALPETADELRSVGTALHADLARDLHLQEDASEVTLQALNDSGELPRYRVISFATHGLVPNDLDGLTEPAPALTNPDVSGGGGDGLLTMGEVLALRLDADWVVLLRATRPRAKEGAQLHSRGLGGHSFMQGRGHCCSLTGPSRPQAPNRSSAMSLNDWLQTRCCLARRHCVGPCSRCSTKGNTGMKPGRWHLFLRTPSAGHPLALSGMGVN